MAHYCNHCDRQFTNPKCPRCGGPPASKPKDGTDVDTDPLSDLDDSLDDMIEKASLPTLASLLRRGIQSGLIKPTHDYSHGVKS